MIIFLSLGIFGIIIIYLSKKINMFVVNDNKKMKSK